MATKKTLSPAEVKSAVKDIKAALKAQKEALAPFASDVKAAEKAVSAAAKTLNAALVKKDKAAAAAAKGAEKLNAKLAALQPAATA